jgi:hypothetical protein
LGDRPEEAFTIGALAEYVFHSLPSDFEDLHEMGAETISVTILDKIGSSTLNRGAVQL